MGVIASISLACLSQAGCSLVVRWLYAGWLYAGSSLAFWLAVCWLSGWLFAVFVVFAVGL
jgi:hypothetical protein